MSAVLDQPEQITAWVYLSRISQLSLELKTGMLTSRGRSVYGVIRGTIIPADMLPKAGTKRNKCLALAMLLHEQPEGPVVNLARKNLNEILAEEGWQITFS